ncbi:hypothetical protein PsorP6_002967 [Peronosclerospora sorghi]|uniref:Uncharacterized protein n=1 Tax=Peronosclerospora sorghi TaxID=230839 RepID=A0ACC0VP75_9STRA|nr:hypothetical protein PsorP6_002967 [Peronosclerospora sorghi]
MSRPPGIVGSGSSRGGKSGGSSTRALFFGLCGCFAGAYYGFYLQSKYMEKRRVDAIVEKEARARLAKEKSSTTK